MTGSKHQSELENKNNSGSLKSSEPEFLVIGRLGKSHGLQGEMRMDLFSDFPERLKHGKKVFIGSYHKEITINTFRLSGNRCLISFTGFEQLEKITELRSQLVFVKTDQIPDLPEGDYYHHDLIGMKVIDEDQKELGILTEILSTGSNDVYLIKPNLERQKELLIPAIKSVIVQVDIHSKTMTVKLQEWL